MQKIILTITVILFYFYSVSGQALPIGLDGKFDDWTSDAANYSDTQNDGGDFDLLSFKVANDSNFLFIQFVSDREIQLNYGNNLHLAIDCDNNASTGLQINGTGAELDINFGTKTFIFYNNSSSLQISYSDIDFNALPSVTSDTFEISIDRNALPDGINPLFSGNTIKICFYDADGGDYMPDYGNTFSYTFDNTPVESYEYISLDKINPSDIRLMTYNTLSDGLISSDANRVNAFKRIITAVNPDIITFNECWNTTQYQARNLLNSWIPLSGSQWTCIKNDNGNITCSKFPVSDFFSIDPTYINRITACIIDLPDSYPKDFVVINSHFKCCGGSGNDAVRQDESDAIIKFVKDIKTPGGALTLPYGTPVVISGDLNLVGSSQQLTTLLTGDIQDNYTFGEDIKPDWDNSDFSDIISFHTDRRIATTIQEEGSDYWPARIDYTICTDEGPVIKKTFIVNTREMSAERLNLFGLLQDDSKTASDHLPKITDFEITDIQNVDKKTSEEIKLYPNPAINKEFNIESPNNKIRYITISDITGKIIFSKEINKRSTTVKLPGYTSGIYFIKIITGENEKTFKLILR